MPTPEELAAAADDALLLALRTGQSVTFEGRTWTSHDLEKLQAIRSSLSNAAGTVGGSRVASFSKGF